MTTTMDRRIADRRDSVREAGARRRLRRLVVLIVVASLVGVAGWFVYQSPYLRVREVAVSGVDRSAAIEVIESSGIAAGVPTINVRSGGLEASLLADPWIAVARVRVSWPGTVAVTIVEHRPRAWVQGPVGWMLVSEAGTVLETAADHDAQHPVVAVGSPSTQPGDALTGVTASALEFLAALPRDLAADARVEGEVEALTAQVGGFEVLLGYGDSMADKARSLAAILSQGPPAGAVISVVSPERPAINPQPDIESSVLILGGDT